MGTFTLTGPGASVDRSQNNVLTWTWTQQYTYESLHRWRLQYRTVGSGTWLNAYVPVGTNMLPNGSAESGVGDWANGSGPGTSMSSVAGGRPGGGTTMAKLALDYLPEYPSTLTTYSAMHPGTATIAVTPGARYIADGWSYSDNDGRTGLWIHFVKADGNWSSGGSSYVPGRHRASQWEMTANEIVAPSDAAYARVKIEAQARGDMLGSPSTVYFDDLRLYRVDNVQPVVAADASGNQWTTRYTGGPMQGTVILPPNFLAAGNWEFRLEAWSSSYTTAGSMTQAFSNTVTSTMVTASAAPTITSPTQNATIGISPTNVTVTYASGQTQLQIRVMDGAIEKYNSGTLTVSGTSSTQSVPFPENGVGRQIQARTGTSGVFSAWATRDVAVSYTSPATPTVTAAAEDWFGLGQNHSVRINVTNPTPTGTQPAVSETTAVWRVVGGTTTQWVGVTESGPGSQTLRWIGAPNLQLQVAAFVKAANGTQSQSAWVTVNPQPSIKGVVLYDPLDTSQYGAFRYNDDGVEDDHNVESALLQYSGRQYPVVEFGPATSRVLKVPTLHLRSDAELALLRRLCTRRSALVYKDKRGRAVLGRVTLGTIRDTTYGYVTSLVIDVLDSWGV